MKYNFWGWEQANIPAVTDRYEGIHTPLDLYDALSQIWCAETCAPRMRQNWMPENKTLGSVPLRRFWRRIFSEDRCTVFCVREETIIVIMW